MAWKNIRKGLAQMLNWGEKPKGHRGIGVGEAPHTSRNPIVLPTGRILNRQEVSADEVEAFLYDEQPLFVHSSDVAAAIYFAANKALQIEYLGGAIWQYDPVSEDEALDFAQAHSKGIYLWDHIRVRGAGNQHRHQKNAVQIR